MKPPRPRARGAAGARVRATRSSTGWRDCRCGRWPRRSARARGCCCTSSVSKDGLVRALLAPGPGGRAAMLAPPRRRRTGRPGSPSPGGSGSGWPAPEQRGLLTLWVEAYGRSLVEPDGPWAGSPRRPSTTGWSCSPRPSRPPPAHGRRAAERTGSSPSCAAPCSTCSPPATWPAPPPRCEAAPVAPVGSVGGDAERVGLRRRVVVVPRAPGCPGRYGWSPEARRPSWSRTSSPA